MKKICKLAIIVSAFIFFLEYVGITGSDVERAGEKLWRWAKK